MNTPSNKDLREFIGKRFSDSELDAFCFDYFLEIKDDFTTGMRKTDKVMDLIAYCSRRDLMQNLVISLQQERGEMYRQTFATKELAKQVTRQIVYAPQPRNPKKVFVSHSSKDGKLAQQIAADLKQEGYETFITPSSIKPGEKWVPAIGRGMDESGIFILLLTENAVQSGWVHDETNGAIALANENKMRIFFLDVQDCRPPFMWRQRQFFPFRGEDYKQNMGNLLRALEGKAIPKPPSPDEKRASNKTAVLNHNTFIHEKTGLEFVRIPVGEFVYSQGKKEMKEVTKEVTEKKSFFRTEVRYVTEYEDIFEAGSIKMAEFWMCKIAVTNIAYQRFIDANSAHDVPYYDAEWAKAYNWDKNKRTFPADKAEHPVVFVNWYDAVAFCEWAALALPTEEQWEKAARGTDGLLYPWGNGEPTNALCNFDGDTEGTTAVNQYSPQGDSPYGCADMSGNVWEWCLNKYNMPEDTEIDKSDDPRVLRGGSWYASTDRVRADARHFSFPDAVRGSLGFRVVAHNLTPH